MVGPAWGSAPLSLQHRISNDSSAPTDTPRDTPTAQLLGAGGPLRTSSGWADDDSPLPDPRTRTPRVDSRPVTPTDGPGGGPSRQPPLARQPSWHQRELAAQQARREAQRRQREAAAPGPPPARRQHSSPFLNLQRMARSWQPLDPETGGERDDPGGMTWREPAPAPAGFAAASGLNGGAEMSEMGRPPADLCVLERSSSGGASGGAVLPGVRRVSSKVRADVANYTLSRDWPKPAA